MKILNNDSQRPVYFLKFLLAICLLVVSNAFTGIDAQSYKTTPESIIKVSGTSNLHDWEMEAKGFNCEGNFTFKGDQLQDINSMSFSLPVTNLKSKEDLMETRAYKALKSESFNKITFKLTSAVVQQGTIKAVGVLTIAGASNEVILQSNYTVNTDGTITLKGSKTIKMTDYKITPPSFMMGALKTRDEVALNLSLKFKK